jgi:glutaredoxin domain-containing cysteine-rich protein 1
MGCKGSKHALHEHGGGGRELPRRYSGTLSLDHTAEGLDAEAMMKAENDAGKLGPFAGWRPKTPPPVVAAAPARTRRRVAPRTPNKTPARAPEEINVWELMEGLNDGEDDQEEEEETEQDGFAVQRSAPGSPVFDPEILDAFRKALDEVSHASPPPDAVVQRHSAHVKKGDEIQMFPGIVPERVNVFQEKIEAKQQGRKPLWLATSRPPPESARRVVVYLTSLRGIRQTYEDCWSTAAVLRGYGVRVDERDLSLHAGYKDELRAALGAQAGLPQVFADGRHLGGAEDVRRLHESGELARAIEACETASVAKGDGTPLEACDGCGGVRFVPCDTCSGSCKVFVVEDDDSAGAFRRCPVC